MPIEDDRFMVIEGQSRLAMMASDAVLCASGTTTLEAMLIGKPMTIAYKNGMVVVATTQPNGHFALRRTA